MSDPTTTGFRVGADVNPFEQAMRKMVDVSKTAQGQVASVFGQMNVAIKAAMALLAGGALLKDAVEETQKFTGEALKLARVLGTNATEASALNVALGDIYSDADTFTSAASKMAKELRTNESALQAMGLKTRDSSGQLRPLNDLMMDSIKVVNGYKQGIDRNIAAQALWGKSAEDVVALLKLTPEVIEAALQKQKELGLVIGQENVEASKAYKAAMNDVGDVMLAVKKTVGDAFIPLLTQLAEIFAAIMPAAVFALKVAISGLVTVLQTLLLALKVVWDMVRALADPLFTLGSAIRKLLSGDMSGATKDMQNIFSSWGEKMSGVWDQIKDDSARTWKEIGDLWGQPTALKTPAPAGKSGGGLVKAEDQMPKWEAELNQKKQNLADQNALEGKYHELSKEDERAFWVAKKDLVAAGSKDAFAAQAKITAATLDIQKTAFEARLAGLQREQSAAEQDLVLKAGLGRLELAMVTERYGAESKQAEDASRKIEEIERAARDQRKQLREMEINEIAANANLRIDQERQQQQYLLEMGLTTAAENLAAERQFESQRYAVQMSALNERKALLDPQLNPVEYARIKEEILQVERQHQLEMNQIQNQQSLERTSALRSMFSSLQGVWATTIGGMMSGTKTLGQGIRDMFKGAFDAVIGMLAQFVAKWLVQQLLMLVFGKTMAASTIAEKSAEAGAGGVASMAAAPWPLNMSAPIFGLAMAAAAMSFAPLASASQGFDIPSGLNPITQLHEEEMVLPAKYANAIRDMTAGEGGGGSSSGAINIYGTPDDTIKLKDLAKVLKKLDRNFAFTG